LTAREKATVAVDVVIFAVEDGRLKTLLVTVREGSFAGRRAFPGGLVGVGESLEDVAVRELGVRGSHQGIVLEQLRTFGDPDRDPSGRVVATAYLALVPDKSLVVPGRRYADSAWFSVDSLPPLAYDHDEMAEAARERLRAKLAYTNIV
jgi:8-oxo-dGTP diphosphatase